MPDAAPIHSAESADRPVVSDLQVDATGRRFRLTFTPGQSLPAHRNPARLEFLVLEGSGTFVVDGVPPRLLQVDTRFQLDADRPHAVTAGGDGLVLEVRTVTANCTCC